MTKNKIVIAGGGTGGHMLPMLSVAKELEHKYEIVIFGGRSALEKEIFAKSGYKIHRLFSGKIHRFHSIAAYLDNLLNILKLFVGIVQAIVLLAINHPKAIFSKGGYVSLPTAIAAHLLGVPVVLHESDLIMGLANRVVFKYAKKVALSFPVENYNLPLDKIVYSGHILRPEVLNSTNIDINILKAELDINLSLPTILVTGGSQGALAINKAVAKSLPVLLQNANVIHLCGKNDFLWLKEIAQNLHESNGRYVLLDYTTKMIDYMRISDLIVTRAGINTLAEIAALKKPSLIIPYQYSAAGHQGVNAKYFEKTAAGKVISDQELNPENFEKEVSELLKDKELLKRLGDNAFNNNQFNGAKVVAKLIDEVASGK